MIRRLFAAASVLSLVLVLGTGIGAEPTTAPTEFRSTQEILRRIPTAFLPTDGKWTDNQRDGANLFLGFMAEDAHPAQFSIAAQTIKAVSSGDYSGDFMVSCANAGNDHHTIITFYFDWTEENRQVITKLTKDQPVEARGIVYRCWLDKGHRLHVDMIHSEFVASQPATRPATTEAARVRDADPG